MAQKFKVFVALVEDLSSVSSTYWMLTITCNSNSKGIQYPLLVFADTCVCAHPHAQTPMPPHPLTHVHSLF